MEQLVRRLIVDPHDADALALAHQAGTQNPQGYAALLERVGMGSADPVFAAHWFNEAAMVWESIGDVHQCNRLLIAASERDAANVAVVERVAQIYRQHGNAHALAQLLERMTESIGTVLHEQPELAANLVQAHQELAGLYAEGATPNPDAAIKHHNAVLRHEPQNAMAIYGLRELLKAQRRWQEAVPLYAREIAVIGDPERKLALYRDEAEVRRQLGDHAGVSEALRHARQLRPDDAALGYEFGLSVIERIDAGHQVDATERHDAAQGLVGLAETYDGEHGMTYAQAALKAEASHDRAMQLADYYAEQLGRQRELVEQYRGYLQHNPGGYCAEKARAVLTQLGVSLSVAPPPAGPQGQAAGFPRAGMSGVPSQSQAYGGHPSHPVAIADELSGVAGMLKQAVDAASAGHKPQAYEIYLRVLETDPANSEALGWVEDFLRQRRKFAELRDVLMAASRVATVSAHTRVAQLRDVASICESKLRDFDTAVAAWKQIMQIDRGDSQARDHLFELLEKQKRWDELAPLLEQQAMNEDDIEAKIALEKKLAKVHETQRKDPASAAEAWVRIASLARGDVEPVRTAVALFESAQQYQQAVDALSDNLTDIEAVQERGPLLEKLGDLRTQLGDVSAAGDAYAEAARIQESDACWQKAANAYQSAQRLQEAADMIERRAQSREGAEKATLLAEAGEVLLSAGDTEAALLRLESASELSPNDDELANRVEVIYHQAGRHQEQVAYLLRRAESLVDQAMRVAVRQRAAAIQQGVGDEDGARDTLELVLGDTEDVGALQILLDMAERRQDWTDALARLKRLTVACEGEARLAYAVREAQILAENLGDLDAAVAQYERVLSDIEPNNQYALHAVADIERRRENHGGSALAYERLLALLDGEAKIDVARQLADLYEGPLDDVDAAIRNLELVHQADDQDFDAVARLQRLAERKEDWPRVALLLGKLIEVEGDDEEASEMTRRLASIYVERLDKGDEALGTLERMADQGDAACQHAYVDLGIQLGWKGIVATKLVAWNESATGTSRADALRQAFHLFLEVGRDPDAETVALALARSKDADVELARELEQVAVRLKNLDTLAVAQDIIAKELLGRDRAEEFVRQAEVMVACGADALDALHHGEIAMTGVEPAEAPELLSRLATLTQAPGHVIDLFDRQVERCKRPQDRIQALALAAQVAAEHGAVDRAREFFNSALAGGVHEETLVALEEAARTADEAVGSQGKLLRTLAEALAAGGQGSRDGGRTRGALLRRAAQIAHRELGDLDAAFAWLGDSIGAFVDDAALDALDQLGEALGDYQRVDRALSKALDEVYDGPLVRKLLRKRADLRRDVLKDATTAAQDLKRLHDLSPADQELTKELSQLLTELGDHKGMIELLEDQILRGREPHVRAELARKVAHLWEEQIGDGREAADAWRRVLRMKAGDKEAVAGLERCKTGKLKKAPPVRHSERPPDASRARRAKSRAPEAGGPPVDGSGDAVVGSEPPPDVADAAVDAGASSGYEAGPHEQQFDHAEADTGGPASPLRRAERGEVEHGVPNTQALPQEPGTDDQGQYAEGQYAGYDQAQYAEQARAQYDQGQATAPDQAQYQQGHYDQGAYAGQPQYDQGQYAQPAQYDPSQYVGQAQYDPLQQAQYDPSQYAGQAQYDPSQQAQYDPSQYAGQAQYDPSQQAQYDPSQQAQYDPSQYAGQAQYDPSQYAQYDPSQYAGQAQYDPSQYAGQAQYDPGPAGHPHPGQYAQDPHQHGAATAPAHPPGAVQAPGQAEQPGTPTDDDDAIDIDPDAVELLDDEQLQGEKPA